MVNKIDSNVTGLSYALEASLGVLPGTPDWKRLEPNSYADFGGQLTTIARNPINPSRQRKKGVITDLDASGGFNSDLTQTNMLELLEGFFFADMRKKGEQHPTAAVAAGELFNMADTEGFFVGSIILASGFESATNNGPHTVDAVTLDTSISVEASGTANETAPANALLQVCGYQFAASQVDIDAATDLPSLDILSGLTAAARALTITVETNLNGEDVTVDAVTYVFVTALSTGPTVPNEILIGVDEGTAGDNLAAAINGSGVEGTNYSIDTEVQTRVTAVSNGTGVVTVTAITPGATGNTIPVSENLTDGSWAGAATALGGGAGLGFVEMGLIPGEWVFIGGDEALQAFTNPENNGFCRIRTVAHDQIEFDKTSGTMLTEAAGSLTISLFFGNIIRNEPSALDIVRRSFQLERTLGQDNDGTMSEYIIGAVPNTIAFNVATADKLTVDVAFTAIDNEQRTGVLGVKDGNRPALIDADAFNTSSDFSRLRMTLLDDADSFPTPLFAYLTEMTLNINNNLSPNKAVSVLGAFDVTAGTFEVGGNVTAYFSDVAAVQAVRDNASVTIDAIIAKNNSGLVFDIPLMALGDGRLQIEQDQPVTLPLTMAAAQNVLGYTFLVNVLPYLPDAAL